MKKESLSINNFLGVSNLDIKIGDFTLLIGPQAVGKSITLKLIYFFRKIRSYIIDYYVLKNEKRIEEFIIGKFKEIFSFECYSNSCKDNNSNITYKLDNIEILIFVNDDIEITFSDNIVELCNKLKNISEKKSLNVDQKKSN